MIYNLYLCGDKKILFHLDVCGVRASLNDGLLSVYTTRLIFVTNFIKQGKWNNET